MNMGSPSALQEIHSPAGACKHGVSTETTLQCAQQPRDAKPMVIKNIKMSETGNRPQDVVGKKKNPSAQLSLEIHALSRIYKEAVCNF